MSQSTPAAGALRIDHVAIACRDVEAMRSWYESFLGFRVVARRPSSRPGSTECTYLAGPEGSTFTLELMPYDGTPPHARKPLEPGLAHIAFRVDDLKAWESKLDARGLRWLGEAGEATGGGRVRSFLDLEENMLQLVERP